MTIPPSSQTVYSQGSGTTTVIEVVFRPRDPTSFDINYTEGQRWINTSNLSEWSLAAFTSPLGQVSAHWISLGGGAGALNSLTGDDAIAVVPVGANINVQGGGAGAIAFTSGGAGQMNAAVQVDGVTIQIIGNQLVSTAAGIIWTVIVANTVGLTNHGYICNAAATLQVSLPAVSAVGDIFIIERNLDGAGLWQITQGAGQQILAGIAATTVGAGGSLTATDKGDVVVLRCVVPNLTWSTESVIGNPNAV